MKNVIAVFPQWLSKTTQNHFIPIFSLTRTRDKPLESLMPRLDLQGTNAMDLEWTSFFSFRIKLLIYYDPDICSLHASGFSFLYLKLKNV